MTETLSIELHTSYRDEENALFALYSKRYEQWWSDEMRIALGLPAQHRYFNGPTPRRHYSRRERRRRRWP